MRELLPHIPDPPASVLVVGRDAACYSDELSKRGCSVAHVAFPKRDCSGWPGSDYHVIILHCTLKWLQPLKGLLAHVRDFLKPNGTLVVYDELGALGDSSDKTGLYPVKEVIVGLYESGFSIKAHERWPEAADGRFHMIVGRRDDVFLRPYGKGDEETILPMFQEVFNTKRSMAHWYWKFRDNPFGTYKIAQAISHDGVLAGHYSGYPVPFYGSLFKVKQFLSFQIGDIMTRPGFRRLGLGKTSVLGRITSYFHHKFCVDHIPFLYGFVAGNHRKFGERFLRYRYMSDIPFHVLELSRTTLKSDGWFKRIFSGIKVVEVHDVGPEFDLLFQKTARDYGLLVQRDAGYLRWRYLDCPDGRHRIFAVRRYGKLVGWSVFRIRGSVLIWGDALFQKAQAAVARMMLAEIIEKQFPTVERIEGWFSKKPPWWTNFLQNMDFEVIEEPNGLVAGVTLFNPSLTLKSVEDQLYYTMGDSDLF